MERIEIKAVEMVRRIRDRQYDMLIGKTPEEIMAFFHQEAEKANKEAVALLQTQRAGNQAYSSTRTVGISRQD